MSDVGWHITIDLQGDGRIFDERMSAKFHGPLLLSDAVERALEDASILHAEPGQGSYQITASPVFR